jgi:hypothetical protein
MSRKVDRKDLTTAKGLDMSSEANSGDPDDPELNAEQGPRPKLQRVTNMQKQRIRYLASLGMGSSEIERHVAVPRRTVEYWMKDVIVVDQPQDASSPGASRVGETATASVTTAGGTETVRIELRPELKPDVLPAKPNGGDDVSVRKPDENASNGGQYGAQQTIDVSMRSLTFDWPSQMIVDMTAMARYNKFPNVQSYHNDLVERSRVVDDLTRWVGAWKGDALEFVERVKPAFIISHSVLEKAEEAKAAADEQRHKALLARSGVKPPFEGS